MAAKDRLAALRACQESNDSTSIEMSIVGTTDDDLAGILIQDFYKEVEELNVSLDRLLENVEDVKRTHSLILSTPQINEEVRTKLERVVTDITSEANKIKAKLKQIGFRAEETGTAAEHSAAHRIITTQHQMLTRRFIEVMNDYQLTQADYRDRCKARIQRQLEITGRVTTDDEIEEMIESKNPGIFTQGIIMESQQAKQTLAEIEARHTDIMKLEKSIRELRDLFVDLATIVELQGDMVNRIENHVALSKSHVDKARVEVNQAIACRSKARIKKCICLTILIVIVVAVVLSAIFV